MLDKQSKDILDLIKSNSGFDIFNLRRVSKYFSIQEENNPYLFVISYDEYLKVCDIHKKLKFNVSSLYKEIDSFTNTLIFKNKEIVDFSNLGNVHTLDLSWNRVVSNVCALSKVYTLNLSETKVIDVSALRNVHTLYLSGTDVEDVSALGNAHTLDLSDTEVVDVSALGNVHTLNLGMY